MKIIPELSNSILQECDWNQVPCPGAVREGADLPLHGDHPGRGHGPLGGEGGEGGDVRSLVSNISDAMNCVCSKDVRLPLQLQRAMAAEAEAAREARAKVIAAEGEKNAAVSLRSASDVISDNPAAMQLRYLQVS